MGVRAVILHDAGIGKHEAGIAGLAYLEKLGMAAAAVSHKTATIGEGRDMLARGVISRSNSIARALGVQPSDAGKILIIGSHGALHGGRPESALPVDAAFAVFNDAGGEATTRLPVLARRGAAGAGNGAARRPAADARLG